VSARGPLAEVRALMAQDRFARGIGVRLVEVGPGRAVTRLRLRPGHLNGAGVVQGGAVFTLADLAFAAACNSNGTVALALDVSITYARAATKGTLEATAVQEAVSRRVSVCSVTVRGDDGEVVALFRGTAYRKDDPIASALRKPPRRRTRRA
jgi:acyl-CoA thioesterase